MWEFVRVVKPGGRILVIVPNDTEKMRNVLKATYGTEDGDVFQYFFTVQELAKEYEKVGFKVVKSGKTPMAAPALDWPWLYQKLAGTNLFYAYRFLCALLPYRNRSAMVCYLAEKT